MKSILIIGGGNMGAALGIRWREQFNSATISVIEPNEPKRKAFGAIGIKPYATLAAFHGAADIVVLAVKPQMADEVLAQLRKLHGAKTALIVSIMAGVPLSKLARIGKYAVRVMPNTPALIGEGISAICAPKVPAALQNALKTLFSAVGTVVMVPKEKDMHAVTAISGSGPAYLFAFMESLMAASQSLGLNESLSRALVTQTIRGAALLADAKGGDVTTLRKQVTSPKGTTEAALKSFKKNGLARIVKKASKAAAKRSKQLVK
jgi:pyrroline-5-carboxylate reductase